MILGVSFSVDCKYLVAFGLADKNLIVIFEISSANVIAMARIGHNEVFQMGFNPFLFTPSSEHHDELILKAGKNTPEKSSSYTLVSCGGKQIKFWTLSEMIEKVDNDVNYAQEAQGFKGRKLVTTKKNQQWQRKYVFEGNNVVTSDSPDIVCYCCLYDGKRGKYAKSRVLTGTSSGSIYIWEQLEDDNVHGAAFWLPRGRLLSIVTGVHEGPIVDLDYTGPASYEEDKDNEEYPDEEGEDGDGWVERIVSGGLDGVLNTWKINRETQFEKNASPFHHETCVSIAASDNSLGQPR
jgi:WD40 repeat protein